MKKQEEVEKKPNAHAGRAGETEPPLHRTHSNNKWEVIRSELKKLDTHSQREGTIHLKHNQPKEKKKVRGSSDCDVNT